MLQPKTFQHSCNALAFFLALGLPSPSFPSDALRIGVAAHAFDHLGGIGNQAQAAAASGANIIYTSGIGVFGYQGLPPGTELEKQCTATSEYVRNAKKSGIRLAIGYVCATSIVKLGEFDKNWPSDFRKSFHSPPPGWRQQNRKGQPLPSWYGGDYTPACMNSPDWRTYEHFVVRKQIESGCDGIFFDNPTVHPQGCYCSFCMEKFAALLQTEGLLDSSQIPKSNRIEFLRSFADKNATAFLHFRGTIAADFFTDMRKFARTVKAGALITANNSLNSSDVLFSQVRTYGYNIYEMSKAEDFVVVEDMGGMPRTLADGRSIEYSPSYKQLNGIGHGKPIVAVTLAEADYHTPPNLVRLAMAEAAANESSYLGWPTWPEAQRERMIRAIRPEADFLKNNTHLLNDVEARCDVALFLPFRKWLQTGDCKVSALAAQLSQANIQYRVICEDDLRDKRAAKKALGQTRILATESQVDFSAAENEVLKPFLKSGGTVVTVANSKWIDQIRSLNSRSSIFTSGQPRVRAFVFDQNKKTIVHLLNLNVQKLNSFEDKVTPATNIELTVKIPFAKVHRAKLLTADPGASSGTVEVSTKKDGQENFMHATVQRLDISSILVIE
jgi:hypothetical protein